MADRVDDFDAVNAFVVGMMRTDIQAPSEPYYDLDEAVAGLTAEGWPVDDWPVINDAELFLPEGVDNGAPWLITVSVEDMVVQTLSNTGYQASASGIDNLLADLGAAPFI